MLNMIVETENASKINRTPQIPVLSANVTKLKNGDVILAAVERIEGDALTLRLSEGLVLHAALQAEIGLAQQDMIEALVEKGRDGFLLHLLNVSHMGMSFGTGEETQTLSQPIISGMLAMLKRNPGLQADMARFLTENSMPDTTENIAVLSQLTEGTGIGALLGRILGLLTQPNEVIGCAAEALPRYAPKDAALSQDVSMQGTGKPTSSPDVLQVKISMADQPPNAAAVAIHTNIETVIETVGIKTGTIQTDETTVETEESAYKAATKDLPAPPKEPVARAQTNEAPVKEGAQSGGQGVFRAESEAPAENISARTWKADAKVQETASQPQDGDARMRNAVIAQKPQEASAQESQEMRIAEIIQKILARPDTLAGVQIKKTVDNLPEMLKTLKSSLVQSDIKNKESCLKVLDQAMKQAELEDRTVRFEHMQLPLAVRDGEYRSAELYVFRNRKSRESAGEAGITILLALETQRIGRVEALICQKDSGISLEFRLEQPEAVQAFKMEGSLLAQVVEAAGYRLTGMRFAELEKKTTVINASEAMPEAGEVKPGIDVKV